MPEPRVTTTKLEKQADGSVWVYGEIDWQGADPSYWGVCMAPGSVPTLDSYQLQDTINQNSFIIVYPASNFDQGQSYYFCAWGATRGLFYLGNSLRL